MQRGILDIGIGKGGGVCIRDIQRIAIDVSQFAAIGERPGCNRSDARTNAYKFQFTTACKCRAADGLQAVADGGGGQAATALECVIS